MQFLSQNMFIIHVIDLSNKTKMEGRGFIFLQKSEKTDSWKKKKNVFFSYFISGIPNLSLYDL